MLDSEKTKNQTELERMISARGLKEDYDDVRRRYRLATGDKDVGGAFRYGVAIVAPDLAQATWVERAQATLRQMESGVVSEKPAVRVARSADGRKCIEWVAEVIGLGGLVDFDSAPGTAAVALLKWVQSSPSAESEFWRAWMSRLPKEAPVDEDKGFRDDLRSLDRFMEQVKGWKGLDG